MNFYFAARGYWPLTGCGICDSAPTVIVLWSGKYKSYYCKACYNKVVVPRVNEAIKKAKEITQPSEVKAG